MATAPVIPDKEAPLVLVTERPEGMTYEAYKELQRQQDRLLRARKKGRMVFISSGFEELGTADGRKIIAKKTQTYRKPKT